MAACIAADFATFLYFGTQPCLYLPIKMNLPFATYPWLLIVGVVSGAGAYGFQYCILNLKWWYGKLTIIPDRLHSIVPLLLVIPVGLWNAQLLGGSHKVIQFLSVMPNSGGWWHYLILLVAFLIIRFVGTMISYGATVPGGIFMPIFVLGGIWGAISGLLMVHAGILPGACYLNMIVLEMTAYIAATEGTAVNALAVLTLSRLHCRYGGNTIYLNPPGHRNDWFNRTDPPDGNRDLRGLLHQHGPRVTAIHLRRPA